MNHLEPSSGNFRERPGLERLGVLASGGFVFEEARQSHNHIPEDLPEDVAARLLKDTLLQIDPREADFLSITVDHGEPRFTTRCLEVGPNDRFAYAYRKGRFGQSRFVLYRDPEPTSYVTVMLDRMYPDTEDFYLVTAMCGARPAPEPWDTKAIKTPADQQKSDAFWASHALVWDPAVVDFTRPFGEAPDTTTV